MTLLLTRLRLLPRELSDWPYSYDTTRTVATTMTLWALSVLVHGLLITVLAALFLPVAIPWALSVGGVLIGRILTMHHWSLGRQVTERSTQRLIRSLYRQTITFPVLFLGVALVARGVVWLDSAVLAWTWCALGLGCR